jgi:hypothetical protein
MGVESSKVFSVLAHELRGPLGVLQGYLRMLRTRRTAEDPETRMLTAMLDATGRISAVARQASELAVWCDDGPSGEESTLALRTLMERALASEHLPRPVALEMSEDAADVPVRTRQPAALCAAIVAVIAAAGRQEPDAAIGVAASRAARGGAIVAIGSKGLLASVPPALAERSDPARAQTRLFSGGGQGLALVLAASVFDRHGIEVGLIEPASDVIVLRIPKD